MIKKLRILTLIFITIFLYSCQSAKDALQGKKRSKHGDEFLVEKKNPLSMPPDFEKMPVPGESKDDNLLEETDSSDIKKILNLDENNQTNKSVNDQPVDIESSILEKIN